MSKRQTNATALRTLRKFFRDHPDINLEMKQWATTRDVDGGLIWLSALQGQELDIHDCNTAACAVGWAPAAGLTRYLGIGDDGWAEYSHRTFFHIPNKAAAWADNLTGEQDYIWNWMFSDSWHDDVDDLIERITYVINHDTVPPDFSLHELWGGTDLDKDAYQALVMGR